MKIKAILAAAAAIILTATSCGVLGNAGQTAATAAPASTTQYGSSVGGALASLYTRYKTDGKIDLSDMNNIVNLATVVNNIKVLKGNFASASSFTEEFANGLISGSKNLINKNNSAKVIDNLVALSGINLSSVTNAASAIGDKTTAAANTAAQKINTASSQVTSAVSTLNSIFSLMKK